MRMNIERIAIIGASGFLGSYLFSLLSEKYPVIGTYFSHPYRDLVKLDIRNESEVKQFFSQHDPELVVVCGGITKPDKCEINKDLAYAVNVKGVENIVKYANAKIIYFSTDYVFDGNKKMYTEEDLPNPINYYGWTKLKAEQIITNYSEENVIIRVAGLYGYNERNNEFLESLNVPVVYKATDIIGSTLLIHDITKHFSFFMRGSGIYHLSSGSTLSRYEFTKMAVDVLGFSTKVIGKKSSEIYKIAKRPKRTTLISVRHNLKIRDELSGLQYLKNFLEKTSRGDDHESI